MLAGAGVLNGDDGNDTLQRQDVCGGNGNDSSLGDGVASMISGGAGADILTALASGNETLSGGKGADLFVFFETDRGVDRVTDFNAAQDALDLTDFGVTAANLAEHATQVGQDVRISLTTLDGGEMTIVLTAVILGELLI